ncbi:polyphosphate kinase 2 family protein [Deinococcus maricopensis]|uniref:Polyphosphate:nucleotide phosphotransferase, PPK2 family n=1 Tax=Deinococcus maricopensis (strain DSM 21211 / LMG 22137 / NRRL B-23946 / LB-34) TaxID=709986 RepID=E8UB05_DEIML|nr:polyphosphate kinase 2 family protein [Deinococcus maricopensis]ADV68244.1 polyphosphate:nucleotide phosphotransferase, PPK2 family [Deinococcus maricopensis DSM 21211]
MNLKAYRFTGGKVSLADIPTDADGGLTRADAEARMVTLGARLAELQERLYAEGKRSVLLVLQARDAGGKDGTVKHVFAGVNPQGVRVTSFKAPTLQERAHDFLWRVHAQTPPAGFIGVFNRSHYEDVLVPRVHGLLDGRGARRRLEHLVAFEALLHDSGTRVVKAYLHISKEEQRQRLQARLDDPQKHWKFDPADLAERELWDKYTAVYETVIERSGTKRAPWYVIPSDHKWYRNLVVSQLLVDTLEDLDPQFPPPTFDASKIRLK